jgi:tetratricopeptide (TPR) repeat protein
VSIEPDPLQLELERAQTLVELGRFEEARAVLTQLLGREPGVARAWCLFAQTQLAAGYPKAALDAAEHAASREPENEWAHRLRSIALERLGYRNEAFAAANEAVAAAPHAWQTHMRLAEACLVGRWNSDVALSAAKRAVELAPNEPNAHFVLGRAFEMCGEGAEAELCYRRALEIDSQHAAAHHELARMRYEASRGRRRRHFGASSLVAAASGFRTAVGANPRSAAGAVANIEVVIRSFLARLTHLIFVSVCVGVVVVWVSGSSVVGRVVPPLLLAIPAGFAVRFLANAGPDVRRRTQQMAFQRPIALVSVSQVVAVALLLYSAVGPVVGLTDLVARHEPKDHSLGTWAAVLFAHPPLVAALALVISTVGRAGLL